MPDWQVGAAQPAATAQELQACVRDLLSLIALPALTVGSELEGILHRFVEALGGLLPIRFCIVAARQLDAESRCVVLWVADKGASTLIDGDWKDYSTNAVEIQDAGMRVSQEATPCGSLRVVRLAMGYGQDTGILVAGAQNAQFPSLTESALLRATTSLMAGRVKSARLVYEREQAGRVKDEFLAMLGHELRNPLAPIVTALDLMSQRAGGAITREQEIIRRQVDHLVRMVDDLLDVARLARGKVDLRTATVEVAVVLRNAIEMASVLIERRGHHLSVDVPEHGLIWAGDPTRLAQIVANLLTNAARYTEPGGEIALSARREDSSVVIRVRDTGIGLDADLLPRVFDLFFQGKRSLDRSGGGLGLGLALVKNLVQMHEGSVEAHSAGIGQGSEFTVRLPLPVVIADSMAPVGRTEAASANAIRAPAANAVRIMLVDDNVDGADAMAFVLETLGYEVMVVYNPVHALEQCIAFRPQAAVLDIGMPVMNGYELARRMRELPAMRDVFLIAMTGYGRDGDANEARQAGFADHLIKPVDPMVLVARISRLLASA
ncbi:MAG: ATP-binding protein [Burkholderiaceae bacterium]